MSCVNCQYSQPLLTIHRWKSECKAASTIQAHTIRTPGYHPAVFHQPQAWRIPTMLNSAGQSHSMQISGPGWQSQGLEGTGIWVQLDASKGSPVFSSVVGAATLMLCTQPGTGHGCPGTWGVRTGLIVKFYHWPTCMHVYVRVALCVYKYVLYHESMHV